MRRSSVMILSAMTLALAAISLPGSNQALALQRPGQDVAKENVSNLSQEQMGEMLRQLGHETKPYKDNVGGTYYAITIQKNNLTLVLCVARGQDGRKLWLTAYFTALKADQDIPADIMAKMLDANRLHAPCSFQYDPKTRTISITLAMDNRNLSNADMRHWIDYFTDAFVATEPLWNTTKWGGPVAK